MKSYDLGNIQRKCPVIRQGVDRDKRITHYLLSDGRILEVASPITRRGKA